MLIKKIINYIRLRRVHKIDVLLPYDPINCKCVFEPLPADNIRVIDGNVPKHNHSLDAIDAMRYSMEVFSMNRKEITERLSNALEKYINPYSDTRIYYAKEVTFDYSTAHPVRVDYMRFVPVNQSVSGIEQGNFYCYEIKSCVADFNSKNGHNFLGDFNYYVMTEKLYEQVKDKIPFLVGVYVLSGDSLKLLVKAKRKARNRPVAEMLLMMFRSANRENIKTQKLRKSKE